MFSDKNKSPRSSCFEHILEQELQLVKKRRLKQQNEVDTRDKNKGNTNNDDCSSSYAENIVKKASDTHLTGLAFSGGGIRSATFNLGVLQALAKLKILEQFDYLSTVSGGGYIGSWFSAWIRRKELDNNSNINSDNTEITTNDEKNHPREDSPKSSKKEPNGFEAVSSELADSIEAVDKTKPRPAMQPDPDPISHLREYSNYLSPKRGLWSTDTWTLGVTYIRNLILTFSLLFLTLIALVLLTRAGVSFFFRSAHLDPHWYSYNTQQFDLIELLDYYAFYEYMYILAPLLFCVFLFFSCLLASIELQECKTAKKIKNKSEKINFHIISKKITVAYVSVAFTWFTAVLGSLWLYHSITSPEDYYTDSLNKLFPYELVSTLIDITPENLPLEPFFIIISALSGWLLGHTMPFLCTIFTDKHNNKDSGKDKQSAPAREPGNKFTKQIKLFIAPIISLLTFLVLINALGSWIDGWRTFDDGPWDPAAWRIVVWGTPLFVFIFSIVATVFVGLAGNALDEFEREWFGRFFTVLIQWTIISTSIVILVVYSPFWVETLGKQLDGFLNLGIGAVWASISAAGALLTRNTIFDQAVTKGWFKRAIVAIAPLVFILGMLIMTVWITDRMLSWALPLPLNEVNIGEIGNLSSYWYLMAKNDVLQLLVMFLVTIVVAGLWSWRIGVNQFSLHSLYADRLIRAYLGASNLDRNANPFTGFDKKDNDVHISELDNAKTAYTGPYLIVNAAINLVSSSRLAWQKRKAASFSFTPKYCGYEFYGENEDNNRTNDKEITRLGGYVKSDGYASDEGISLGKAMTISGAAASPNMGYHSNSALTFLMTTFNVRLGWWLPNTTFNNPVLLKKRGPGLGLFYLFYELLGQTNSKKDYVYLSDGGHFENLGIYELVRRRCRIIIASDAEADPKRTFSGLGNAIEKCRTDLGVPIDIDVSQLKPDPETGHSPWHCAVGCIRYSAADPGQPDGTLLYIKASLTGDEPQDVKTYAEEHCSFPHETTVDQWFDETQFESYRTLGEHIVKKVLGNSTKFAKNAALKQAKSPPLIECIILEVRKHWYSGSSTHSSITSAHDAELADIMDTLRTDTNLAFLDGQLYPTLEKLGEEHFQHSLMPTMTNHSIPGTYKQFRAGFYFCKRLLQFMQQVYYDNQLELEYASPRNRGWMNLFRRWSLSRMLRFTWTITAGTYGARFQSFCEDHLVLESGEPSIADEPLVITAHRIDGKKLPKLEFSHTYRTSLTGESDWKNVEKPFGLHYYETRIIREFINAYVSHSDIRYIKEPLVFQVFPIKVSTDDVFEEQADNDMEINAGMLIAGPALLESKIGNAILYFRIRPSMRNMDMARKSFIERRFHKILNNYPVKLIDVLPPLSEEVRAAWQHRAYRDVHHMQRNDLDHCRWFSQILEEVGKNDDDNKT